MKAISAEASSTDAGAEGLVLATGTLGPFRASFRAAICNQLVSEAASRRQVGDAALRSLDSGEALLDVGVGDFRCVGHGISLQRDSA
jgi:hypothetical protein